LVSYHRSAPWQTPKLLAIAMPGDEGSASNEGDPWSNKVICPSGCFATAPSSPFCKNIALNTSGKSVALVRASRPERGALRNVINAGWDAVDAGRHDLTKRADADGEVVWS
jgi:hypothetical protein